MGGRRWTLLLGGLVLAGCNTSVSGPAALSAGAPADGFVHYAGGGRVACDGRPVALDGSHARVETTGACRRVRVSGDHNDVIVGIAPGSEIAVSGSHNDVWWHPAEPGARPAMRDSGQSNSFHREDS